RLPDIGLRRQEDRQRYGMLKLLTGLLTGEGVIRVGGAPLRRDTLRAVRRRLGLVLQNAEQQMFMPTVHEDLVFGPLNYGLTREEAEARADAALSQLGIAALKERRNHSLSVGERRMAAIAVVLAMEPEAILMDEPTAALDPRNRRRVIEVIRGLRQTRLVASHDLDMVLDTCARVVLLSDGAVAADGAAETVLRDRALLEAHGLELPLRLQ
ncbi:MAG: energy-coupling factor ABC transporter ATP-binding protein, partial [Oscillospiraceae bacterium]|nr:energy-coupling factor ABC transporter ATP-binding protein [Oscillospiraceae bacterium]